MAITMEKLIYYLDNDINPFEGNPYVEDIERLYQAIKKLPKGVLNKIDEEGNEAWKKLLEGDQLEIGE